MKILDFICELFSLRKSAAIITRNEVLNEVIDSVHIDSVRVYGVMRNDELYTPEFKKGYHEATKQALLIIARLKK